MRDHAEFLVRRTGRLERVEWRDELVNELHNQLSIETYRIPVVILSAVGIYIAFMILTRLFGSRVLTSMSGSDAVVIIMFGAVAGRVIIGHPPSLLAGILGLATLMALEAIFGEARKKFGWSRILDRRPILLMFNGEFVSAGMHVAHMADSDIYSAMRRSGVGARAEVGAMILEPTGDISVIRRGQAIDRDVLSSAIGYSEADGPRPEK